MAPRSDAALVDPYDIRSVLSWFMRHAAPDASIPRRLNRLVYFFMEAKPAMTEVARTECEVAEMVTRRLELPEGVQKAVRYIFEQWDGKGMAYGLKGEAIPVASRILYLAQLLEVIYGLGGAAAAESVAKQRRGKDFDPNLVGAFLELARDPTFWSFLDQESVQNEVLSMKPPSSLDQVTEEHVDTFCDVIADFIDIKSRYTWGHSRTVASLAENMAHKLGLDEEESARVRRAALVHDLGKAAVPGNILDAQGDLSENDWERFRLHPYYTDRILGRVEMLKHLAPDAATHHERLDGQGYHRQLAGDQIPLGGRILAVADVYATLSGRTRSGDVEGPLRQMRSMAGDHLDADCCDALVATLGGKQPTTSRRVHGQLPHSLSDREIEVLVELAKGLSNKEIAKSLFISQKTVGHHLENIYGKLDVSCRTSAVVFAVQNGIMPFGTF